MLRKAAFLLCLLLMVSVSARAQSDKIQLFGGYSYQHVGSTPSFDQNGWEGALQYKFSSFLGVVADFDGHYGQVGGLNSTVYTYLFGPQISFGSRLSPFAQFLVGGGHAHFTGNTTDDAFAWTLGGGADYRILPGIYWRVIQVGYQPTYFFGHTQNNVRISTGLVAHF
jgi:Outer membrane protein beta-barrel domain